MEKILFLSYSVHFVQWCLVSIRTAVDEHHLSLEQFNKFIIKSVAVKSIIRIATLLPSDGHTLSPSDGHTFFITTIS